MLAVNPPPAIHRRLSSQPASCICVLKAHAMRVMQAAQEGQEIGRTMRSIGSLVRTTTGEEEVQGALLDALQTITHEVV